MRDLFFLLVFCFCPVNSLSVLVGSTFPESQASEQTSLRFTLLYIYRHHIVVSFVLIYIYIYIRVCLSAQTKRRLYFFSWIDMCVWGGGAAWHI